MKVVIAAAGTGGHINPGLAIAKRICEYDPNSQIVFFGTDRGLENTLVPKAGYGLEHIKAWGLKKEISITNFKHMLETWSSKFKVKKYLQEFKPDIVIGTGGYICGPVISAAVSLGIPTMLHESNAYPGTAVSMYAPKVDCVMVGFEETIKRLPKAKKCIYTGTPTNIKKIDVSDKQKQTILNEMNLKSDMPIVLIFGGSQGAKVINDAVINLLKNKLNKTYQIIWATGPNQFDIVKDELVKDSIDINNIENAKILPYIYNMEELMNISDLLVCRSGAMTCTEVCIVGKPCIFVPLPSISANRQEDNARVLEKIDSARVILNNELTFENLSQTIDSIVNDKEKVNKMGQNALQLATYNVQDKIFDEICKLLKIENK
jgi:UDP-N-acetylglucosamine--N-acetylmuramyl-(pentapeptide) pyrophosphoryl-undecaprenol N-acetylglucosamine transferase